MPRGIAIRAADRLGVLSCFRRRFPERAETDYDEMVRLLGYVWDCSQDGFANVVGFRCAAAGGRAPRPWMRCRW